MSQDWFNSCSQCKDLVDSARGKLIALLDWHENGHIGNFKEG